MQLSVLAFCFVALCFLCGNGFASETLTPEPDGNSYNFVSHYRITISAKPEEVWPVLIDLKAWMYDFDLSNLSGTPKEPGQVLNLYDGREFKIQIANAIPNQMLAMVNLPLTFRGEFGTGVGIMTLHETDQGTEVSLTMSRRYTWLEEAENPLRETRESCEFKNQTSAMWEDRFLTRLKQLAENPIDAN